MTRAEALKQLEGTWMFEVTEDGMCTPRDSSSAALVREANAYGNPCVGEAERVATPVEEAASGEELRACPASNIQPGWLGPEPTLRGYVLDTVPAGLAFLLVG